jgi:hypothetical protein
LGKIPDPEPEEADVMDFFESEEDALMAKELLEEFKRNNAVVPVGNDNFGIAPPQRAGPIIPIEETPQRLTPAQIDSRFLLETEIDIPADIKRSHWLLGSHHNELLNIQEPRQYAKYARENRDVVRTTGWQREHRKTSYADVVQIEHYSNRLLTKSWKHGERLLQSTIITRNQNEDFGHSPEVDARNASNVAGGLMGRLGRMFGR